MPTAFPLLQAEPGWRAVDLLSDLHLEAGTPATLAVFARYLHETPADALILLGDLFEVWVGDDACAGPGFAADCAELLREAAARRPLFLMHGNRDFLVGEGLAASVGLRLLQDPTLLAFGDGRWLLSHGDALCLSDTAYQAFRAEVRQRETIERFLRLPLADREALVRQMRDASRKHQRGQAVHADVDDEAARTWLQAAGAGTLVHGHTHRPGEHELGGGMRRIVLSDWDADADPLRAEVLRLAADGSSARIAIT